MCEESVILNRTLRGDEVGFPFSLPRGWKKTGKGLRTLGRICECGLGEMAQQLEFPFNASGTLLGGKVSYNPFFSFSFQTSPNE